MAAQAARAGRSPYAVLPRVNGVQASISPTRPPARALPPLSKRDVEHRTYLRELQARAKKQQQSLAEQADRMQRRRQLLAARILSLDRSCTLQQPTSCEVTGQAAQSAVGPDGQLEPHADARRTRPAERRRDEQPLRRACSLPARPTGAAPPRASSPAGRWAQDFSRWKARRKLDAGVKVFVMGGTGRHSGAQHACPASHPPAFHCHKPLRTARKSLSTVC